MEPKIGEIFEYNCEWYQCIKADPLINADGIINYCEGCSLAASECDNFNCIDYERSDKELVIFKKLEKVGEPFERNGYMYQEYKVHTYPLLMTGGAKIPTPNGFAVIIKSNEKDMEEEKSNVVSCSECGDNRFEIITRAKAHLLESTNIRDSKEEMEVLDNFLFRCWQMGWLRGYEDIEKKILNLKPFDLEAAKQGKPVCTRDGRPARIICFDAKFPETGNIVTLVEKKGVETTLYHYNDGRCSIGRGYDLMMLPEKKEGWMNVYRNQIHDTLEGAEEGHRGTSDYIQTIKVEWEE